VLAGYWECYVRKSKTCNHSVGSGVVLTNDSCWFSYVARKRISLNEFSTIHANNKDGFLSRAKTWISPPLRVLKLSSKELELLNKTDTQLSYASPVRIILQY
jgi:hypothetical protein